MLQFAVGICCCSERAKKLIKLHLRANYLRIGRQITADNIILMQTPSSTVRQFSAKSTFMGLITRGLFWSIFTPWKISIDLDKKRVDISRRNWYLVSKDTDAFQFSSVRHIRVDESLFGADLHIRMYAGEASVKAISKKAARTIRELLLDGQAALDRRNPHDRELYNDYDLDEPTS